MGNINMWAPDVGPPDPTFVPKFDPLLGFPNGRKERIVKTTLEEMESAAVSPDLRDYCVDKYMAFLACKRVNFPLNYRCKHEVHDYHDCQYEDLTLRMKEFERERRLSNLAAKQNIEE